jgi:arylsulfatase A-like enzyme
MPDAKKPNIRVIWGDDIGQSNLGYRMPDAKKPNILVIWGDDIGQSNLGCYTKGVMGYRTPNIDRIES